MKSQKFSSGSTCSKVNNAIPHWINLCPVDNEIGFPNTHPLDGDLSGGWHYLTFEQPGCE